MSLAPLRQRLESGHPTLARPDRDRRRRTAWDKPARPAQLSSGPARDAKRAQPAQMRTKPSLVRVDAAATRAVLGLHLGAVTDGALAVGLAGLLDGQVHGGAGSRLKDAAGQVARGTASVLAPWRALLLAITGV